MPSSPAAPAPEGAPGWSAEAPLLGGDPDGEAQADLEQFVQEALDSIPAELRRQMSNVQIVIDDDPPHERLLGLYQGVPLTRRGAYYSGALPDKITIYREPLERLYGHDPERLRTETKRVTLHEIAHHFGISDERLVEIDRY